MQGIQIQTVPYIGPSFTTNYSNYEAMFWVGIWSFFFMFQDFWLAQIPQENINQHNR
jgi:hypothetical protein